MAVAVAVGHSYSSDSTPLPYVAGVALKTKIENEP